MRPIVCALLVGCAYQSGSFDSELQEFPGQRTAVDCLDVSIQRRPDLPQGDAVLAYAFGNRCDHPALVDLSAAIVVGRDDRGTVKLAAFDPFHEIKPLRLDGRAVGKEALSYRPLVQHARDLRRRRVDRPRVAESLVVLCRGGPMNWLRTCFVLTAMTASAWADPPPEESACGDPDDVVGYRECPRFGGWGQNTQSPDVFIAIGANIRHFGDQAPPPVAARTTMPSSTNPGSTRRGNDALSIAERIGVGLPHGFYTALDFELGNFEALSASDRTDRELVLDGLLSFGLRLDIGPLAVSGELSGGAMEYGYQDDIELHTVAVLEARARADVWLGPWFTAGVAVGQSLLRADEWLGGIYLTCHSRSYAGGR